MDVVKIKGAGFAGQMFAHLLYEHKIPFELHEKADSLPNLQTWCFFESDLPENLKDLVWPLLSQRWSSHSVRFPSYTRQLDYGYLGIRSADLAKKSLEKFGDKIVLSSDLFLVSQELNLSLGEASQKIPSESVVDCSGWPQNQTFLRGYQKFYGLELFFPNGHGITEPVIMNATVPQKDGYRFFYLLPWSETEILVEDTYYSKTSELELSDLKTGILSWVHDNLPNQVTPKVIREEVGVLPIPLERIPIFSDKIGAGSGLFHYVTGYTVPQTLKALSLVKNVILKKGQTSSVPTPQQWTQALRAREQNFSKSIGFYLLLNQFIFKSAPEGHEYKMLQHFYKKDIETIQRFYRGDLRAWDKISTFIGKPPVPILPAVKTFYKAFSRPSHQAKQGQALSKGPQEAKCAQCQQRPCNQREHKTLHDSRTTGEGKDISENGSK